MNNHGRKRNNKYAVYNLDEGKEGEEEMTGKEIMTKPEYIELPREGDILGLHLEMIDLFNDMLEVSPP